MKKLIIFGLIGILLLGCQQTSKAVNNNQVQADLDLLQDSFITTMKKILPIDRDEYTTVQDVFKENNMLFYKIILKNISKEGFEDPIFRAFMRVDAVSKYCNIDDSNSKLYKKIKLTFPNGNTYTYYYENEEPFIVHVDENSCKNQ